jgi:hypothetical protein
LDNQGYVRLMTPRPSAIAGKTVFTYTGENAGIPTGNAPSILDKDYTITAETLRRLRALPQPEQQLVA